MKLITIILAILVGFLGLVLANLRVDPPNLKPFEFNNTGNASGNVTEFQKPNHWTEDAHDWFVNTGKSITNWFNDVGGKIRDFFTGGKKEDDQPPLTSPASNESSPAMDTNGPS